MENQPSSRPSSGKTQRRRALELLASREGLISTKATQREKALADLRIVGKKIEPSAQSGFGKRKSRRSRRSKRTRRTQRR